MTFTKALPLILATALAAGSGTTIAVAQDTNTPAPMTEADAGPDRGGDRARRDARTGPHHGRAGGGAMMREILERVDADASGSVTQAEIDTWRAAQVSGADADGDGALGIGEFEVIYRDLARSRVVDAFQALDEDGNGAIDARELDARFGSIVERMDRNGDGALDREDHGRGRRG